MKFLAALLIIGSTQFAQAALDAKAKKMLKAIDEQMAHTSLQCEGSFDPHLDEFKVAFLIASEKKGEVADTLVVFNEANSKILVTYNFPGKHKVLISYLINSDQTEVREIEIKTFKLEQKKVRRNVGTLVSPKYETVLEDVVIEHATCK